MDEMMLGPGSLAPKLANASRLDGVKGIGEEALVKLRRMDVFDRCLILSYIFCI
jgi:hypothetical protein